MKIGRRELIALLAGSLVDWPGRAAAQPGQRTRRLGVLMGYTADDREANVRLDAFKQALAQLGWAAGRNLQIEHRWAAGNTEQTRAYAAELVALAPDAILAATTVVVRALLRETRTIPIVFLSVSDPAGDGFVQSLSRPAGNATGFTNLERSLSGKWLELVKELAPTVTHVAALYNPAVAAGGGAYYWVPFEAAATSSRVEPVRAPVQHVDEMEAHVSKLSQNGGLVVMPDGFTVVHRARIISLAARYRVPTVYPYRYYADEGALMSYGIDLVDQYRRAARYVERVLQGERAGDLPVQAPVKFELAINLKTAKALGIEVPPTLLARADEVIE
jgi:putative ABC transport system substrate-binding protein